MSVNTVNILLYGDSKTAAQESAYLLSFLGNSRSNLYREYPTRIAVGGRTMALAAANVDTELAAATGTPDVIGFNIGANDVGDGSFQQAGYRTTWIADGNYVLDALHAKYPNAKIYIMKVWRRNCEANCDTLANDYLPAIMAGRSYCSFGGDERVFLKGSDDGATMTTDGIHPNTEGRRETCRALSQAILAS